MRAILSFGLYFDSLTTT